MIYIFNHGLSDVIANPSVRVWSMCTSFVSEIDSILEFVCMSALVINLSMDERGSSWM